MVAQPRLLVVDASVVLKWQLDDEEYIAEAIELRNDFYLEAATRLIAPSLLAYEVVNALATASRRKRVTSENANEALVNLMAVGVELREVEPAKVLSLSLRHNLAAYDAAYLALAEAEGCELWTGDRPFYQAVRDRLPRVKWIGDYAPPQEQ